MAVVDGPRREKLGVPADETNNPEIEPPSEEAVQAAKRTVDALARENRFRAVMHWREAVAQAPCDNAEGSQLLLDCLEGLSPELKLPFTEYIVRIEHHPLEPPRLF